MSAKENREKKTAPQKADKFVEGVDYYFDDEFMVLTGHFLLKRGSCCGNGCRHCPYPKNENVKLQKKSV